jgi:putative membrane protein insertion efficiency factor
MIRKVLLKALWLYQKYFTLLGFGSCRYYPTCSEYAKWQFEENPLHIAFYQSALRILRCNQLFPGGIDYPEKRCLCEKPKDLNLNSVKYWLVPKADKHFFIIKNFRFKG